MSSIAKKPRSVKGQKGTKKPPRFTIKKDSLGRRYAIDKRTGKRATLSKAEKERKARKKVITAFRGIITKERSKAAKKGWETRRRNERSQAAKKGWETRRKKVIKRTIQIERPPPLGEVLGGLIPEGMRMHVVGGIADRSEIYPKVANAADRAWINMQVIGHAYIRAKVEGKEPPPIHTPRFDHLYGEGHGAHVILDFYVLTRDYEELDQAIDYLYEQEDNDYDLRELYTLYFSPELS